MLIYIWLEIIGFVISYTSEHEQLLSPFKISLNLIFITIIVKYSLNI